MLWPWRSKGTRRGQTIIHRNISLKARPNQRKLNIRFGDLVISIYLRVPHKHIFSWLSVRDFASHRCSLSFTQLRLLIYFSFQIKFEVSQHCQYEWWVWWRQGVAGGGRGTGGQQQWLHHHQLPGPGGEPGELPSWVEWKSFSIFTYSHFLLVFEFAK